MFRKSLQLRQLSNKIQLLSPLQQAIIPAEGWIKAIRSSLGISLQQLGKKLGVTRQSVLDMERREQSGAVTLHTLQEFARSMDMQLVYGFVPRDGSLDALIERKAKELATQIVMRTSASMKLEDQENSPERIEQAIAERTAVLKSEIPKILWD